MAILERILVFGVCINVYLLTEGIVYLGCYEDSKKRVLPNTTHDSETNTPEECARRCSAYRYAGVEFKVQCFCGNSLNASRKQESECNDKCPGDKNKTCGDSWRISVYTNWVTACGLPPAIENGNATLRKGTNLTYGSIADVYCDPGFMGKPTITCLSNTSWEKTTCEHRGTLSIPITPPSGTTTKVQTTGTTHSTQANSPTTTQISTVNPVTSPITTFSTITSTSTTQVQSIGTTNTLRDNALTTTKATSLDKSTSPTNIQSTTSLSAIDGQSVASKQQVSKGSTTSAVAAGGSVTVAISILVVVIVLVLRNKKKLCFAYKKMSQSENINADHHITLAKVESKPTAFYEFASAPASNQIYGGLHNASTSIKDAENYYASVDNGYGNAESKHNDSYHAYQNTNKTHGNNASDTHAYFELEKYRFEKQRNTLGTISLDAHDNFVLEKQQPHIGNNNGVSTNEVHPYFVLEKEGAQPVHDIPQKEANPYFVLEKQNTGNSTPISTANALELDDDDGDMYQEIDTKDTYAGIADLREANNDYDYTNQTFRDSNMKVSDNVYNHLNSVGDEYDHVGIL